MEFEVTCGCRFSKPGPIMQEFSSETSEYLSIRLRASGLVSLQRPSQLSCSFSAWRPTMARNALRISADHPIRCSTCRTIAITVATARASATTAAAGTSSTIATGIGGHRQLLRLLLPLLGDTGIRYVGAAGLDALAHLVQCLLAWLPTLSSTSAGAECGFGWRLGVAAEQHVVSRA